MPLLMSLGNETKGKIMLHCVPIAAAPVLCDLFAVEAGAIEQLASKPRNATEAEVRAYNDL